MSNIIETFKEKAVWTLTKYASEQDALEHNPFAVETIDGNLLLNEGINYLLTKIFDGTGTLFDTSNTYLGVGDSSTAASAAQTGLQASTNKLYKAMFSGDFPSVSGQTITFKASFGSSEANFSWQEFTVANGNSDSAVNLNRKVSDQGTKVLGQVWELTLTVTLA